MEIEIIPAVMPSSFADLREKLSRVVGAAPLVQIDVMDGKFVPSRSWPYGKHDDNFEKILAEEEGMPYWEEMEFEIDLMVSDVAEKIEEWIKTGAMRFILHVESLPDALATLKAIRDEYGYPRDSIFSPELGLAINPDTPNSALEPLLAEADFVQFMGISKIGYQGQPFDQRVIEKIRQFRAAHPDISISVDGGVSVETAGALAEAGANRLVSGSAVFGSSNIMQAIRELEDAAGGN